MHTAQIAPDPTAYEPTKGLVFNIMRFALHDGPGIRTTVFLKGCPLRCWWCHNPESQQAQPEVIHFEERCIRCGECVRACPHGALALDEQLRLDADRCERCGECAEACPTDARQLAGRWMSVPEVLAEVARDQVFYDESGGGMTVSGGEPLMQREFVEALLAAAHGRGLHTVLDTCGLAHARVLERVRPHVDLFLYDLKVMDRAAHRRYTGARNDRILRNLQSLAGSGAAVIVRLPVIPGVNDGAANLDALCAFLTPLGLRAIDLLPYHRIGSDKYQRLHLVDRMNGVAPPSAEHMDALADRLRRDGFAVRIGG